MSGLIPQFLRELGFVLLEHRGHGLFAPLSPVPPWFTEVWGISQGDRAEIPIAEKSPFLENFLYEANAYWSSSNKGLCHSEVWMEKSQSGREIPLQANAISLEGTRLLALHSPETQFQERSQLLQAARNSNLEQEMFQREIQKKEILLHCIIHDLSQPLSVMSVALDCLADEQVSERGKGILELGRKASHQQLSMIRDILQAFSADLNATLTAEGNADAAADLLVCAQSVLSAFTPVYAAEGVLLKLDERIELRANWRVRGETSRIQRIFSNLLENALRYTPRGSKVTIGLEQDGDFVKAFVDDEGPGLPADLAPAQIFALFSKGKEGGGKAGLGLYFCRVTVERCGGAIGCLSLPDKGSRFWFRLPKPVKSIEVAAETATAPGRSLRPLLVKKYPMRILLADDQKEIRLLTTHQLERSGHYVVAVANGKEAVGALQHEAFDVVLMDEDMPVMSGLEALRAMRLREKESGHILIIALTGYNTEPDRARLLKAGFDFVIGKPFRLEALEALIQGSPLEVPPEEKRHSASVPAETAVASLLDRVGGDEKLARNMISTFMRDTPRRMAGIQKALQQKDSENLASLAHALKGSLGIFGAEAARHSAQQLEDLGRAREFRGVGRVYDQLKEEIAGLEANLRGYAGQKSRGMAGAGPKSKRQA